MRRFAEAVLADDEFVAEVDRFVAELAGAARISSLAQLVLKTTSPGIPDIYQGCELWTDSLVDPDNRRPVDYALRRELLAALGDDVPDVPSDERGVSKLFVTRGLLALRRAPAGHLRRRLHSRGTPPGRPRSTPSGSNGATTWSSASLASCSRSPIEVAGGVPRSSCRPADGPTCSPASPPTGRVLLDDALQRFPVAVWESRPDEPAGRVGTAPERVELERRVAAAPPRT